MINKLTEYRHTGIGCLDSTILGTMEELGIKHLLTHDYSFKQVDTIIVDDSIS